MNGTQRLTLVALVLSSLIVATGCTTVRQVHAPEDIAADGVA